jgi:hypothetical protein
MTFHVEQPPMDSVRGAVLQRLRTASAARKLTKLRPEGTSAQNLGLIPK